ncbi:MAG TPA: hypothetical protein VKB79_14375 [Bryobacteraceae bacterium]|nr:hypothetical protein [Bryobacteraceae bacterium]
MSSTERLLKAILTICVLLLGLVALQAFRGGTATVSAASGRYDYVSIISPVFVYKGVQGVLLLDSRNGNIWFVPKGTDFNVNFKDPVFVIRLPLDKLDNAPQ